MSVRTYIAQHHESQKVTQNVCCSGASVLAGIFMSGVHWLMGSGKVEKHVHIKLNTAIFVVIIS